MASFHGWGSTASRLEPLWGGSLLFTTKFPEIPGSHFIDQRKDERLSQPWSHPVVLNAGPLDCESSTLTALLKFSTKLAWTLNKKNLLASLHCLYALYHILNHRIENQSHLIHLARAKSKQNHFHLHHHQLVVPDLVDLLLCHSQNFLNQYLNLSHNQNYILLLMILQYLPQ